jgi:hypothetical protein
VVTLFNFNLYLSDLVAGFLVMGFKIAGCSKTVATFLQVLKEIGARRGEIARLEWSGIDF